MTQMSAARAAVLERLGTFQEAVTVSTLAEASGQHTNTLREHLDALVEGGLVERHSAPPKGRGRPAILYRALPPESARPQVREYAALATALAGHIHRTSSDPRSDAIAAGRSWGTDLATHDDLGQDARTDVVALLDQLGFDPSAAENGDVLLHQCPLLDTAKRYPDVVCNVHLGLVHGVYDARGTDGTGTELQAFSEPGACRLRLPDPATAARPATSTSASRSRTGSGPEPKDQGPNVA